MVEHADPTLHVAHERIVEGLACGRSYTVLEDAAEAAIDARIELAEAPELIDQVALDTYDPEHGHSGTVTERDRADLERGRERAWTAQMTAAAIIDRLEAPTDTHAAWPE